MDNSLEELNNFLKQNNAKENRTFSIDENGPKENVPGYAVKQVNTQVRIFEAIKNDPKLLHPILDYAKSFSQQTGMDFNDVMNVCMSLLTHLIFIKKIKLNIKYNQDDEPTKTQPKT
jgi:hypothetical protein